MKPQDFINKWLEWAKNKEDINDEILADLDAMNKELSIPGVGVCIRCEKKSKRKKSIYCIDCLYERKILGY